MTKQMQQVDCAQVHAISTVPAYSVKVIMERRQLKEIHVSGNTVSNHPDVRKAHFPVQNLGEIPELERCSYSRLLALEYLIPNIKRILP